MVDEVQDDARQSKLVITKADLPKPDGSGMRISGTITAIIGGALAAYAIWGFDPSVATQSTSGLDALSTFPERIVNNGLLQQQLMLCLLGVALFLAGIVFAAGGYVVGAMEYFARQD